MDNSPTESSSSLPPPVKKRKTIPLPLNVKIGLLVFLLASSVALVLFPNVVSRHSASATSSTGSYISPPFILFLVTGLFMVGLTCLLFLYLGRLKLGFGKTALVLALGFNAVIAVIKLILSPNGLYLSSQRNGGIQVQGVASDPNTAIYYVFVSATILFLYVISFRLIYQYFVKRMQRRNNLVTTFKPKKSLKLVLLQIGLVIVGGAVIVVPIFLIGSIINPSFDYLFYVFGALGVPLVVAIGLGIFLAYKGFAAVEKQVIITGNSALLASFFWLGISLIVLYHIMWVIFMLTLIHIWPFNTYSPK